MNYDAHGKLPEKEKEKKEDDHLEAHRTDEKLYRAREHVRKSTSRINKVFLGTVEITEGISE